MSKFWKTLVISGCVSVLSLFGILTVSAANSTDCLGFRGTTNGTEALNEGVFQFDGDLAIHPGAGMTEANAACIKMQSDLNTEAVLLEGWVWNDNLGLVSLKGRNNTGYDGGAIDYRSYLYIQGGAASFDPATDIHIGSETTVTNDKLQLGGYWWGDNIGWIKLNCREFTAGEDGDTADFPSANQCVASKFRVFVKSFDVDTGIAVLSGHAWSDSQGWIDFDGVELPLSNMVQNYYPKVTVKQVKYESNKWVNTLEVPRANSYKVDNVQAGDTGYKVEVEFYGSENLTGARLNSQNVDFCFIWTDNRYLDYNRIDPENPDVNTPSDIEDCYPASNANSKPFGLLDKYLVASDFTYYDGVFTLKDNRVLRSQVPALGSELYLSAIKVGDQTYALGEEYALNFLPPYDYKLFQGDLVGPCSKYIPSLTERVLNLYMGFNENITFCGDFFQRGLDSVSNLEIDVDYNYSVIEGAGLDLTDLYFDPEDQPYLICPTEIRDANYKDLDDALDPGEPGPSAPESFVDTAVMWLGVFDRENECENGANASLDAVNIDSVLTPSELVAEVSYRNAFGHKIVREAARLDKGLFTVSQANIEGNVQSSAIQLFDDDVSYSSSGSSVRAETREGVLKDISESLKGSTGGCKVDSGQFSGDIASCKVGDSELYLLDFRGADTRYSVTTGSDLGWTGEAAASNFAGKTLVVLGSSIIVDSDLYFVDSIKTRNYSVDAAYGLVALQDGTGRGGNVYITSGVTDIRGHIYADGSVYAVEMAELVGANGGMTDGYLGNIDENLNNLRNQLTIVGQVVSKNTIGGGTARTPRAGDGTLLSEFERGKARAVDLNFWRYSPMTLDLRQEGSASYVYLCGQEDSSELESVVQLMLMEDGTLASDFELDAPRSPAELLEWDGPRMTWRAYQALADIINQFGDSFNLEVADFFCWDEEAGRTSVYFDPARGVAEPQEPFDRYVLNILFKVAPKGLPLF